MIWQPDYCTCGHTAGDHRWVRTRGIDAKGGLCGITGCECKAFELAPPTAGAGFASKQQSQREVSGA